VRAIVCIKQVPDVAEIHFDPATRTLVREGVPLMTNPFDRPAIALAVDLKQRFGARTMVATMGPPAAKDALYEALASGVERAVHLCDRAFAGADTLATARALAALARREGFDLIVCGKHTVDGETAQVGPEMAELLGIPHVSGAAQITWSEDGTRLVALREADAGDEEIEVSLPCLVTVAEHLMPPIGVRKPALEAARQQPVETLGAADLGLREDDVGAAGSPTRVAEIRAALPVTRPPVEMVEGPTPEVAATLADRIARAIETAGRLRPALIPIPANREAPRDRAIWVVVEQRRDGALSEGTTELLGHAAIALADPLGAEVVAVRAGPAGEALVAACAAAGADAVLALDHPALASYTSEGWSVAVASAIEERRPAVVLFSSTERGRDFAPRVAARLDLGLTGDAIGLEIDGERRLVQMKPAFGGHVVAPVLSRTVPAMATVRPGVLPGHAPTPSRRARVETLAIEGMPAIRTLVRSKLDDGEPHPGGVSSARVVVGVGMGIGDPTNLALCEALASAVSGVLAATRRVTDKGWLPRSIQVGLTGKVIAPDVYIAVGIRGLPNHTVGIQRAGTIVAINKDPKAPIFQMASFGAVADAIELLPALNDALRARLAAEGA
jgi:electron transfer flavoprotein alpha subunit